MRVSLDVRGHKKAVFPAARVIEKKVKVNIMLFRTLCSIEFQGPCSRNVNLPRSDYCIFVIYGPQAFYRCLIRVSLHNA